MATTTQSSIEALRDHAALAAAARETAHAKVAALARTVQHCRRIAEPNIGAMAEGPVPTLEEVLTARAQMVRAEQALADAQLAALKADRTWGEAEAALREARQTEFHARKRAAITALAPKLMAARRAVDDLAAIEVEEQDILGPQFARETFAPAWNGLMTGSSTFEPMLDVWLATVRNYGLLDESPASK